MESLGWEAEGERFKAKGGRLKAEGLRHRVKGLGYMVKGRRRGVERGRLKAQIKNSSVKCFV